MKAGPAAGLRRTWLRAIDLVQARLDRTPDGTPGSDGPDGPDPRLSWPQRLLIAFNVLFVVGLLLVAVRLNSFEEAVGSIIRIDVPAGVLADLVDTMDTQTAAEVLTGMDRYYSGPPAGAQRANTLNGHWVATQLVRRLADPQPSDGPDFTREGAEAEWARVRQRCLTVAVAMLEEAR